MDNIGNKINLFVKVISTFDKIIPHENSLILCDIDDTVLRYDLSFEHFFNKVKKQLEDENDFLDDNDTSVIAMEEFNNYRDKNIPFHTEKEAFERLEKRIDKTNSNLFFITSRGTKVKDKTITQLASIGIDVSKYPIYFTFDKKITKAEYIDKFIDWKSYSQVFFIDDISLITKQVKKKFPDFLCYVYKYDFNSNINNG